MDKKEYDEWKNHRLTKKFHQYLTDYRSDLMERWATGMIQGDDNIAAISRCQMADEIANLEDGAIEEFYKNRKVEVKDAE